MADCAVPQAERVTPSNITSTGGFQRTPARVTTPRTGAAAGAAVVVVVLVSASWAAAGSATRPRATANTESVFMCVTMFELEGVSGCPAVTTS
jgi:hypothetical protein